MVTVKRRFPLRGKAEIFAIDVEPGNVRDIVISYVITDGDIASIIDPGPQSGCEQIIGFLREEGFKPKNILVTHIHLDHAGSVGEIIRRIGDTDIRVFVHPKGARHLIDPSKLWIASKATLGEIALLYGEPTPVPESHIVETYDNQIIDLGDTSIKIIHTPGHASHHQTFFEVKNRIMFTGDSLGMWFEGPDAYVPSTPPPFHYDKYVESVGKMKEHKPSLIFFPHNTQKSAEDIFDKHLEQLDTWVEKLSKWLNNERHSPMDMLSLLRQVDINVDRLLAYGKREYVELTKGSIEGLIDFIRKRYV